MQEFDNLIRFCAKSFNEIPFCLDCAMSQCRKCNTNYCYNCLSHIHSIHTKDEHYACEKVTYNYILKYGYRYASELAWAFFDIKSWLKDNYPISIFSVGCGPSTELYGAIAACRDSAISYIGFDINDTWQAIQRFNIENLHGKCDITYYNRDFIEYCKTENAKCEILVLNYFLSDFVKYNPNDCYLFVDDLVELIQEGRFSTIIINDIMLLYNRGTGYECMEKIAGSLKSNQDLSFQCYRRHFTEPNMFQFEYGEKHDDRIGFTPIVEESQPFEPFQACGSIQLIIRTVKKILL